MAAFPETWTAEEYRGRAESGRNRPLRLLCSRVAEQPSGAVENAEFYVKGLGLPEITEQSLFSEILGNVMAHECGILTPDAAFIDLPSALLDLQEVASTRIRGERFVGSRSLGPGTSPPVFGRVTPEQLDDMARIYAFDLCTQNPDRQTRNHNALVLRGRVVAFDFEACFSFLYPIVGASASPWQVSRLGIASNHAFRALLQNENVEWPSIVSTILEASARSAQEGGEWLPPPWREWGMRVQGHMMELTSHEQELVFEVVRSLR